MPENLRPATYCAAAADERTLSPTDGWFIARMLMPSASNRVATCDQKGRLCHSRAACAAICLSDSFTFQHCWPQCIVHDVAATWQMLTSATRSRIRRRSSMRSPLSAYFMDVLSSVTRCVTVSMHTSMPLLTVLLVMRTCHCAFIQPNRLGWPQRCKQ
jgi:hypothetical protein